MKRFAMIGGLVIIAAAIGLVVAPRPVGLVVRPMTTPTPATISTSPMVAGATTAAPASSPSPVASFTPEPAAAVNRALTPTPAPTKAPLEQAQVTLQLKSPAGSFQYSVNAASVTDACNVLTAARDQGMVKSATIDDSYQAVLKSAYVREINGYYNNWTFKVNGSSPKGCSLASVKKGDTVLWEYQ